MSIYMWKLFDQRCIYVHRNVSYLNLYQTPNKTEAGGMQRKRNITTVSQPWDTNSSQHHVFSGLLVHDMLPVP